MTAAYVVFIRHRMLDESAMAEYSALAKPSFIGHNVTFHVRYGKQEVLEGGPAEGVVILEFSSWQEAKAWYASEAYQKALAIRLRAAEYTAVLVEGIPPVL